MAIEVASDIGPRLRLARKARNHSLSDVAGRAGMSSATLSRIETGRQDVTINTLFDLSEALGVEPGNFFTADGTIGPTDVEMALKSVRQARHAFETATKRAEQLEDALTKLAKSLRAGNHRK